MYRYRNFTGCHTQKLIKLSSTLLLLLIYHNHPQNFQNSRGSLTQSCVFFSFSADLHFIKIQNLHCSILFPFPWPKSWPKWSWRLASLIKDSRSTGPYTAENQKCMLKKDYSYQSICNDKAADVVIAVPRSFRTKPFVCTRTNHSTDHECTSQFSSTAIASCNINWPSWIRMHLRFINFGWKDPEAAVFFPTWAWDLWSWSPFLPLCSQYY